jgi:tight adherence protein B
MLDYQILAPLFAALGIVGILVFIFEPYITGAYVGENRKKTFASKSNDAGLIEDSITVRKKETQRALIDLENSEKEKRRTTFDDHILQSGVSVPKRRIQIYGLFAGLALAAMAYFTTYNYIAAGLAVFVGACGLPLWTLNFLSSRRRKAYLKDFPNAIDVIVRGLKAGLPLADSVRIISTESQEPVRSEFKKVIQHQVAGIPLAEAIQRMFRRMPLAEVNFLAIVIMIQSKTGGNLSEALANLSKVIRERHKMKDKIIALSNEAKTSAIIIGSLPFIFVGILFYIQPDYIAILWTTKTGIMVSIGSVIWMMIGGFIIQKMINFDF